MQIKNYYDRISNIFIWGIHNISCFGYCWWILVKVKKTIIITFWWEKAFAVNNNINNNINRNDNIYWHFNLTKVRCSLNNTHNIILQRRVSWYDNFVRKIVITLITASILLAVSLIRLMFLLFDNTFVVYNIFFDEANRVQRLLKVIQLIFIRI